MATSTSFSKKRSDFSEDFHDNFEKFIKTRLNWSKVRWEQEGDSEGRLRKLMNSMNYWYKKLEKAYTKNNIIVTLYNSELNANVSLTEVLDAIWALDKNINIAGYTAFRNPRYLSISFNNEKIKEFVKDNLKKVGPHSIVHLDWAAPSSEHVVKVHWFSNEMKLKHVSAVLGKYVDISEQYREDTVLMNGVIVPSGIVYNKGVLKEGFSLENIPHLVNIEGLECLVTVYGRDYLCLTCDLIGHRAKQCPTPFCGKCKKLRPKSHVCAVSQAEAPSYAQKVKGTILDTDLEAVTESETGIKFICKETNLTDKGSAVNIKLKRKAESTQVHGDSANVYKILNGEAENRTEDLLVPDTSVQDIKVETKVPTSETPVEQSHCDKQERQGEIVSSEEEDQIYSSDDDSMGAEESSAARLQSLEKHLSDLGNFGNFINDSSVLLETSASGEILLANQPEDMEVTQLAVKRKNDDPFTPTAEDCCRTGMRATYSTRTNRSLNKPKSRSSKNLNESKRLF